MNEMEAYTVLLRGMVDISKVQPLCEVASNATGGEAMPFVICTTQSEWQEGTNFFYLQRSRFWMG